LIDALKNFSIDKSDWTPVKFGDVVFEPKESVKDPIAAGVKHVVGLEHIDSEDIHLRRSANIKDSTTFTKTFDEGDVLFGRRRAYLKKAAQADFKGICSGDIIVMRAKENLLPELLPFIVNNDQFFDFAIMHSAGGLSPRVKFKSLAEYKFLLPPKEFQLKLSRLLWAGDNSLQRLFSIQKKLEAATQAQRRSLNVETCRIIEGRDLTKLITKGSSPKWQGFDYSKEGTLFVTSENVLLGKIDISSPKYLPLAFHEKQKRSQLRRNDVLINIVGASIGRAAVFNAHVKNANINQAVALVRTIEGVIEPEYLVQYLLEETNMKRLLNKKSDTARANLSLKDIADFKFHVPSTEIQIFHLKRFNALNLAKKSLKENIDAFRSCNSSFLSRVL